MEKLGAKKGPIAKCMEAWHGVQERSSRAMARVHVRLASQKGQGTTEYAILVGVLVVIAIAAIVIFRPKIQELWNAIAEGISGL